MHTVTMLIKNKVSFLSFTALFRVLLDVSYLGAVSPSYAYAGFKIDFLVVNYGLSWLIYCCAFIFIKESLIKVSDYFFVTALLFVIAPLTSLYGLDSSRPFFPVLIVILSIFVVHTITRVKLITFKRLPTVRNGRKLAIFVSLLFVLFLLVWYYVAGVEFNLDITKTYDFRGENAELSEGGILAYTNSWTYKTFNVFLIGFALHYKRYFFVLLLIVFQIYFFAASTHKIVLFLPLLLLGICFYFRKTNNLSIMPLSLCGIILITLASYFLLDDIWLSSLFSRRVFFVPAHLTFVYFDFFSNNPHIFWSNSVLSKFLTYPYDLDMAYVVGRYLGSDVMGANNGFVASGFAHAGLLGVFLYSLIIGLILRFINDITTSTLPTWLALGLTFVPLMNLLMSSDLFTVMLTHGFMMAIILLFMARTKCEFS